MLYHSIRFQEGIPYQIIVTRSVQETNTMQQELIHKYIQNEKRQLTSC